MKKLRFLILLILPLFSFAQVNELGISLAGSNYIGDVGSTSFINPNDLAYGLVYKWNVNSRIAFRADATYIKIKGDDASATNTARQARGFSFKNSVKELALGLEYNYYDYSMKNKAWRSTPYIIVELALYNYNSPLRETTPNNYETEGKTGFTIPFGIGYKTTLGNTIGLAFETKFRYSFTDNLDYTTTTIPSLNFGNSNNDDWYVTTGITLVFGFGRKGCYVD